MQNLPARARPGCESAIKKPIAGSWPLTSLIAKKGEEMAKKNKSQEMAQSIIGALKDGTAPWTKPWTPDNSAVPHNPVTGTRYRGVNFLYLSMQGKPDPRWVTFNQARKKGWQVKRGSKGTTVQFWQFEKDKKTVDDEGKTVTQRVKLERPLLRHYYVFNGSDIEGMPELTVDPKINNEWERHDRAENILRKSGAEIEHISGDRAAYYPVQDNIQLPKKGQFDTPDKYYATALHELGHWTGHKSRLDRDLMNVFGSQDYAREELRAEIASYMLGMQLGIGHDPGQHLSYLDSWITYLEDHPTEIFKACTDAEKIQTFIMDLELEHKQEQEATMERENPYYIVTDDSLTGLSPDGQLNRDIRADDLVRFDDPASALQAALQAKQTHREQLEGTEVFVYQVLPPDDLQEKPVLVTGTPQKMKAMWDKNIGGEFPENILSDEVRAMPGMPESQVNKLTGRRFISFFAGQEMDAAGNINLELQQALQRGTTIGVLRFENALEKSLAEKSKINMQELNSAGIDGIIFTEDGKPVVALATDKKQLHKGMYQAVKGLEKTFLNVPYEDKDRAKELGALWSKPAKSWYIPEGLDSTPFARWQHSVTGDNPQQQFADFIRNMGGNLQGELPQMDGKLHRIPEKGAKPGNKNIAYLGYLDGVPAGYVKNFRGGEKKWKMSGVVLTNEDRTRLKKEGLEKKARREKKRQELYNQTAKESEAFTRALPTATGKENYFSDKNLVLSATGAKTDSRGNIILPMKDVAGKQWSHLTLQPNGFKQILKDSRLQGTFALVGAKNLDEIKGDFNLAEGYSTAATIHEATGQSVLITGTGNNLKHVARALRNRHPERNIFILADDDKYLTDQGKMNTGRVQSQEAARAVGGHAIYPDFAGAKTSKERTDFRDMAKMRGKQMVADYIAAQKDLARSGKKIEREQKKEQKEELAAVAER